MAGLAMPENGNQVTPKAPPVRSGVVTHIEEYPSLGQLDPKNEPLKKLGYKAVTDDWEAFEAGLKLVKEWEPKSDTFFLSWGPLACALTAGLSARPIFVKIKSRAFKTLPNQGKSLARGTPFTGENLIGGITAGFAISAPALLTLFFHTRFTKKSVMTQDPPCPPCRQMRAVTIQMLFGVVHPAIMALLGAKYLFELETGKAMFEKGKLLAGVKKVWHLHKTYIFGVAAAQAIAMIALHYLQEREWYDINLKLLQRIEAAKLTAKDFTHQEHL